MRQIRTVTPVLPTETGRHLGLAFTLWLPPEPRGGVVVLHGAGSAKESHHDFARALLPIGLAAVTFDQRGHGESEPALDGRAAADVAAMAGLLRERTGNPDLPIGLRGSSMGGYLAIVAAAQADARAVVAICPAPAELLRRGVTNQAFDFVADPGALDAFLAEHDAPTALADLPLPVLLMHAEGDERVPVESSRALEPLLRHPDSRLIVVPGGHHRSIQHDGELQAISLRFLRRALGAG